MKILYLILCFYFICTTGFSETSFSEWKSIDRPLVYNFFNMYQPCVVEVKGEEYKYKMWFMGWSTDISNPGYPGSDAIFHGRSKDLLNWQVLKKDGTWDDQMKPETWRPVITAGQEEFYDKWHAGDPSVVYKDGVYFMALSATSEEFDEKAGYPSQMVQCIMGAVSVDGINWKKTKKPLLIDSYVFPPKANSKRIGDFHRPSLMWDDGKWKLWFDYWNGQSGSVCMGYAENKSDFFEEGAFQIKHDINEPLLTNWPNPEVVKIGEMYYSYSDAPGYQKFALSDWRSRQIREAISKDGIRWEIKDFVKRNDESPMHVPQTLVVRKNGKLRQYLFYSIQRGGLWNGQYDYRYKSINAMYRDIFAE